MFSSSVSTNRLRTFRPQCANVYEIRNKYNTLNTVKWKLDGGDFEIVTHVT